MKSPHSAARTRRAFLRMCLAMPAPFLLAACAGDAATGSTPAPAAPAPTAVPPTQAPAITTAAPTTAPPPAPVAPPTQLPPAQPAITQAAHALPPTPACGDDDHDATPAQTEGPYYTSNTPERASLLEPGVTGTKLVV